MPALSSPCIRPGLLLTLGLSLLLLAACQPAPEHPTGIQHVIIIGVDGMSPDGIRQAETPVLNELIANGAATMTARAVLPTSSSSNWASMIMGAGPEQHGITSNGWERETFVLPAVVTGPEAPLFPTIFSVVRDQRPDATIGAVYHWGGFGRLFEKQAVDHDVNGSSEYATAEAAAAFLRAEQPTFTFVHLDHVDGAGHGEGHGTPAYYAAVSRADSLIGQILDAAREAGMADEMLVIVSADHGGIGYGHGGETLAEIEIPFILYGRGVKPGYTIEHPVYTYDNAATAAFALGLTPPYAWIGRPVRSAFEGFAAPPPSGVVTPAPPAAPVIHPARNLYDPPGGLFVDQPAEVRLTNPLGDGTLHYTLDGTEPTVASPVYEGPFTLDRSAVVRARTILPDGTGSRIADGYFRLVSSDGGHGVRYDYYEGDFAESLPVFGQLRPARTGTTYEFRLAPVEPPAEGPFAVRFRGFIQIDTPGDYTFYTLSDDGSKLYIADEEVVDNDGEHGTIERSGRITLTAGRHPITVTYFQGGGGWWLDVYYSGPDIPKQIIPADRLFPDDG